MIVNPVRYVSGNYQIDKPVSLTIKNSVNQTLAVDIKNSPTTFATRVSVTPGGTITKSALSLRSVIITGLPSSSAAKVLDGIAETSRNGTIRFIVPITDCSVEITTA